MKVNLTNQSYPQPRELPTATSEGEPITNTICTYSQPPASNAPPNHNPPTPHPQNHGRDRPSNPPLQHRADERAQSPNNRCVPSLPCTTSLTHPDSAPALFTPQYPTAHVYSVVISKTPSGTSGTSFEYNARLVLCTGPERALHSEGVVLLVNGCLCESPVDALADLLEGVYERAGREWGVLGKGRVWPGRIECASVDGFVERRV